MLGDKKKNNAQKGRSYGSTKSQFKAKTAGLEHVVFDYGPGMRPDDFQTNVDSLAEHLAGALKKQGTIAAKSIKTLAAPQFLELDAPGSNATTKQEMLSKHEFELYLRNKSNWDDCNGRIYEKFLSRSSPSM